MQTKLAFIFVLHVVFLGLMMARRNVRLRPRNIVWVFGYLFAFYVAWGVTMNAVPSLYVPTNLAP